MVHDRERLALGLEPRDHLSGVHAGFDDFQRDLPVNGAGLLGEPDFAHPAFPQSLQQAVRANRFSRRRGGAAGLRGLVGAATVASELAHGDASYRAGLSVVAGFCGSLLMSL